MKDAVLYSEQEAAGYDDGEFHGVTVLNNNIKLTNLSLSSKPRPSQKLKLWLRLSI